MNNNERDKIALFRFLVLSEYLNNANNYSSKHDFYQKTSLKKFCYVDGTDIFISVSTLERWMLAYQKHGFDGLLPKGRSDVGRIRKIDVDLANIINHYVDNHPRLPSTAILEDLIKNGYITNGQISLSTINRYVKNYKADKNIINKKEMRRYEAEHVNDVWCCDTTYSFKINDNGVLKRTFIITIIDDASRLIVGCDVFFNDNYVNFLSVLRHAVEKYGKPKLLNVDNGAPYRNNQIELLCARIGITLHHCAPYEPTQKSKIERWFRTMKDHFMALYDSKSIKSLGDYRDDLLSYVKDYNNKPHSSLNNHTPLDRFFNSDDQIIHINDDVLDKNFLLEVERKVSADGVISLDNKDFEVPYQYQNKKIILRYSSDFSVVYVVNPDDSLTPISLLDKVANSKIKRKNIAFNTEVDA